MWALGYDCSINSILWHGSKFTMSYFKENPYCILCLWTILCLVYMISPSIQAMHIGFSPITWITLAVAIEATKIGFRGPQHDDVIKWKHFPRYWPFVRGPHRSPVNSPHKGQWRGALMLSLICVWINGWINNRVSGDLRRYRAHYDVIDMTL